MKNSKLDSHKKQIIDYVQSGKSKKEICTLLGVSYSALFVWCKKHEIYTSESAKLDLYEAQIKDYARSKKSSREIAKILNVNYSALQEWLKKNGLLNPRLYYLKLDKFSDEIKNWLKEGLTQKEIATRLNISPMTVALWRKRNHLLLKSEQPSKLLSLEQLDQYETQIREHIQSGKSIRKISEFFNVSYNTLLLWCKNHNIFTIIRSKLDPYEDKIKNYIRSEKSLKEICALLDISYTTLLEWCKKRGVYKAKCLKLDKYEVQIKNYIESGKSMREIANILNIAYSTLYKWCKKNEVSSLPRNQKINQLDHYSDFIKKMVDKGYTSRQISEQLKQPVHTVRRRLRTNNLKNIKQKVSKLDLYADQIKIQLADGFSQTQIAKELKVSVQTLHHWIRRNKVNYKKFILHSKIENQIKQVIELTQQGVPQTKIANLLNVDYGTLRRARKMKNIQVPPRELKLASKAQNVKELIGQGLTLKEISNSLKVTETTLRRWLIIHSLRTQYVKSMPFLRYVERYVIRTSGTAIKKLDPHRDQIEKYLKAGWSKQQIARTFGVSINALYYWRIKNGLFSQNKKKILDSHSKEVKALIKAGATNKEISLQFGVHYCTVSFWLLRNGLQTNRYSPKTPFHLYEDQIINWINRGHTLSKVAKKLGLSRATVRTWLKEKKLFIKKRDRSFPFNQNIPKVKEWIQQNWTIKQMAMSLKISAGTLARYLKKNGLATKNSENRFKLDAKMEQIRELLEKGKSLTEVAKELNISAKSLGWSLRKFKIVPKVRWPSKLDRHAEEINVWLSQGLRQSEIARNLKIPRTTLQGWIKYRGKIF